MIEIEAILSCEKLDGTTLTLLPRLSPDPDHIAITDGERTAIYVPAGHPTPG